MKKVGENSAIIKRPTGLESDWLSHTFSMNSCFDEKPTEKEIETIKKFGEGFLLDYKTHNKEFFEFKEEQTYVDCIANPFRTGYLVRLCIEAKIKVKESKWK